jgi:hypothetical protein
MNKSRVRDNESMNAVRHMKCEKIKGNQIMLLSHEGHETRIA